MPPQVQIAVRLRQLLAQSRHRLQRLLLQDGEFVHVVLQRCELFPNVHVVFIVTVMLRGRVRNIGTVQLGLFVVVQSRNGIADDRDDQVHHDKARDNDKHDKGQPGPLVDCHDFTANVGPGVQSHDLKEGEEGIIDASKVIFGYVNMIRVLKVLREHDSKM